MRLFYTLGIYLYVFAIRLASLSSRKAAKWLQGRENLLARLNKDLAGSPNIIWFHCASLGEFEQGRPLMEIIRSKHPGQKILLTFFSPSGYEIRKTYPVADWVYYLPSDTPAHARSFLDMVNPAAVFIVKYEFWYNFLTEIGKRKIPAYLVSGIFREKQHFFKWYGSWFSNKLTCFKRFYLQDENSAMLLKRLGFTNTMVSGDPRVDRVMQIAGEGREIPLIKKYSAGHELLIAGSAWGDDLAILAGSLVKSLGFKLVIAPHETDPGHVAEASAFFSKNWNVLRFSDATEQNITEAEVLIIDNVGMLSALYRYGSLAFIGGGFGEGIHNILEASVYGLPVIFGPRHKKFTEAVALLKQGGAFCIRDVSDLDVLLNRLQHEPGLREKAKQAALSYVRQNAGAASRILKDAGFE